MVQLYFHLLFGVISWTLLLLPTGLGPALRLIGLILVEKQMVEDLYLTTVTVIEYYWARGTWILIDISERLNRVRCVRPPIQRGAICVCWLMESELKRNRQGSLENDFFYWSHPCKCCCKQGINSRYLHQSRLFTWTPPPCVHREAGVRGQTSTPSVTSHYFQPTFQDVNGLT